MKAFNNNQQLKNELLVELKKHQELDDFIQGQWLTDNKNNLGEFKGCFYGCTMQTQDDPIEKFSEKYNIDLWYCYLTEKIFEKLPKEDARLFPYQSIEKIHLGFDFNIFKSKFFKANLTKQKEWITDENVIKVLDQCIALFEVPFNEISESAARSAESAARSAESAARSAESAARSAESAAESAESAAESAESAAESAAWSAAESARSAAWSAWSAWSAESAARSAAGSAESARSAARSAAWSAWSAWSAESAARSAAGSAARSAESAARSAAWSAATNHYIWMRDLIFELLESENN